MTAIVEIVTYLSFRESISRCLSMHCSKGETNWPFALMSTRCGESTHLNRRIIIKHKTSPIPHHQEASLTHLGSVSV
jgi:hypothetical protein